MNKIEAKRADETKLVTHMIKIYCRGNKHSKDGICEECANLMEYASLRKNKCPLMETKTFCNSCRIHCYKQEMRDRIREVMRYSGRRMIFKEPVLIIRHVRDSIKAKKKLKKEENTSINSNKKAS